MCATTPPAHPAPGSHADGFIVLPPRDAWPAGPAAEPHANAWPASDLATAHAAARRQFPDAVIWEP